MGMGGKRKGGGQKGPHHHHHHHEEEDPGSSSSPSSPASGSEAEAAEDVKMNKKCPHVGKAVTLGTVKKATNAAWTRIGVCGLCTKAKRASNSAAASNFNGIRKQPNKAASKSNAASDLAAAAAAAAAAKVKPGPEVWMCLRCGAQTCGPSSAASASATTAQESHLKCHLSAPRSDLHCVVLNVGSWVLYCGLCCSELYLDSYKKLHEAVELVKRVKEAKPATSAATAAVSTASKASSNNKASSASSNAIIKIRGLSNLGNTCFFNAVVQCLSQTHPLISTLESHCRKGVKFETPEVTVQSDDDEMVLLLEPLTFQLAESGVMTQALATFIKEMNLQNQGSKNGVYNPSKLFSEVCRKSPQFKGFHQEDAHELLRHLLDGLRVEEIKRQRSAILKQFGLSEKTDPKSVAPAVRRKLQALARHSNYTIVDKVFGGQLVSTIVCEQCHNSSQIYEQFLDISLPLIEEKTPRPSKNSSDLEDKSKSSTTQQNLSRKERAKAKREKRRNKKHLKKATSESEDRKETKEPEAEIKTPEIKESSEPPIKESSEPPIKESSEPPIRESSEPIKERSSEPIKESSEPPIKESSEPIKECSEPPIKESSEPIEDHHSEEEDEGIGLTLKTNEVSKAKGIFEEKKKKITIPGGAAGPKDGDEEDDEGGDGYSEEDEEWEWEYGEQWNEEEDEEEGGEANEAKKSEEKDSEPPDMEEVGKKPMMMRLVSLNPLPPEVIENCQRGGSSEREDEKEEEERKNRISDSTGASSDGDVEDNVDFITNLNNQYNPDSRHLDPHMEQLSRKIRGLSVASSALEASAAGGGGDLSEYAGGGGTQHESSSSIQKRQKEQQEDNNKTSLKEDDWVARSLTSMAPRYVSTSAGECSIYSCLAQFTAPELLTGNNKWACERCATLIKQDELIFSSDNNETDEKSSSQRNETVVLSNASKQILVFSPPAVLTIHLKRFQQTMCNLRKISKHVSFPLVLNLAPFLSSTSVSTPNVNPGVDEVLYYLFGVVEHSGRLHGGHYTAYVKVRPKDQNRFDRFYSSPPVKTEEIGALLAEIERKCREKGDENDENPPRNNPPEPFKWYHVSDSSVTEVSEERVLKAQAYILFYERFI